MYKWYWVATFQAPDGKRYQAESLHGCDTTTEVQVNFEVACSDGYLVAQGIPEGSRCVDAEMVLRPSTDEVIQ